MYAARYYPRVFANLELIRNIITFEMSDDSEDDLFDEDMDVVDAMHNDDEDLLDDEGYYVAMFLRRIIAK